MNRSRTFVWILFRIVIELEGLRVVWFEYRRSSKDMRYFQLNKQVCIGKKISTTGNESFWRWVCEFSKLYSFCLWNDYRYSLSASNETVEIICQTLYLFLLCCLSMPRNIRKCNLKNLSLINEEYEAIKNLSWLCCAQLATMLRSVRRMILITFEEVRITGLRLTICIQSLNGKKGCDYWLTRYTTEKQEGYSSRLGRAIYFKLRAIRQIYVNCTNFHFLNSAIRAWCILSSFGLLKHVLSL